VYGGGGISPDIYVPYDTSTWSAHLGEMAFSDEMRVAVRDYFVHNRPNLRFKDVENFIQSFNSERQIIANYIALLPSTEQKSVLERIATPVNQKYFSQQIKAQLARHLFHDNGYYSVKIKDDRAVNKALAAFNGEQYSLLLAKIRPVATKQTK
jgi:carboxyl-terminal processing protease